MPEAPPPPPLTPYLTVPNASEAIAFYECAFGASVVAHHRTLDGQKTIHAAVRLENGGLVLLCDDFPEMSGGRSRTPGVDGNSRHTSSRLARRGCGLDTRSRRGARVAMPLADMFWGDRYGVLLDPAGHRWSLATRQREASAEERAAAAEKYFPSKKDG